MSISNLVRVESQTAYDLLIEYLNTLDAPTPTIYKLVYHLPYVYLDMDQNMWHQLFDKFNESSHKFVIIGDREVPHGMFDNVASMLAISKLQVAGSNLSSKWSASNNQHRYHDKSNLDAMILIANILRSPTPTLTEFITFINQLNVESRLIFQTSPTSIYPTPPNAARNKLPIAKPRCMTLLAIHCQQLGQIVASSYSHEKLITRAIPVVQYLGSLLPTIQEIHSRPVITI